MITVPSFLVMLLTPLLAGPVVYFMGHAGTASRRFARYLAPLVLLATWIPFIWAASELYRGEVAAFSLGTVWLRFDGLSLLLAAAVLILSTAVSIYSIAYVAEHQGEDKYHALLLLMTGAMLGLGCAGDLFNLWLWFEIMTISSYFLVAFYVRRKTSLEAGVKYLVQSTVGSALVLLGIALVFAQTGTLDIAVLAEQLGQGQASRVPELLVAGALFITGFGVKVAVVPLHTWLPDAHAEAPSGISALLSAVVIETGLIALLRALTVLAGLATTWGMLFMAFGVLNMFFGNLLALRQKQVKRLLAFSSVSHIGYMLFGLGVAFYTGSILGSEGSFFHLLSHALMKGLAFLSAGALLYVLFAHRGDGSPLLIADMAGAARRYPLVALAISISVLGLGGLPPLVGFMSKWQVLLAGVSTRDLLVTVLVLLAALNSVLSLGYYAPLVNTIYRREQSAAVQGGVALPVSMSLPLVALALLVVLLGILPGLAGWLTGPAALALGSLVGG
jgi:proton-translocating NADH-quinone oxidoreductase chain N